MSEFVNEIVWVPMDDRAVGNGKVASVYDNINSNEDRSSPSSSQNETPVSYEDLNVEKDNDLLLNGGADAYPINASEKKKHSQEDTKLDLEEDELEDFEDLEFEPNKCMHGIEIAQTAISGIFKKYGKHLRRFAKYGFLVLFFVYFGFAVAYNPTKAKALIVITCLVVLGFLYGEIRDRFGEKIYNCCCKPIEKPLSSKWKYIKWVVYIALIIGIIAFLIFDVGQQPERLVSAGGLAFLYLVAFLSSTNPSKVRWRPVLWGLGLQLIFAIIILRWPAGYVAFKFIGDQVQEFLSNSDEGAKFVFGEKTYLDHPIAMKVLPVIIYFSAVAAVLYYWGVIQWIIGKMAFIMQFTMGTTAVESFSCAANIFISMMEAAVMIKPFVPILTDSELFAVMVGGMTTVAGLAIAIYIEFGAPAQHVLSAAIMSAPAAMALAKVNWPETKVSKTRNANDVNLPPGSEKNSLEAASNGAEQSKKLIATIIVVLISFLGIVSFLNKCLSYFGGLVGHPILSFQNICSYVFYPLAILLGCDPNDAGKVASLIGIKIFVLDAVAFMQLGEYRTLHIITERSAMLTTYALIGWSNLAAMTVYMGLMSTLLSPKRKGILTVIGPRAMIISNMASFSTACIAGLLHTGGDEYLGGPAANINSTMNTTLFNNTITNITTQLPDIQMVTGEL
ncbi:unnamed protein product [Owenia fusiformis]|uniref:Uncharacterized protein n=1 Tax=Owenia fusiformis TaxID=6347 RepID=A0A8J1TIB7_OWEFU|nr:unnamed protein product [Owenia fusiformis]